MKTIRNLSDNTLIRRVKKGDSEAFEEICRKYENIFYKVCQKYSNTLMSVGLNVSDIFEEKNCIIYHCILSFDTKRKTKLSTYIGNYARYLCLNSINSRKFIIPSPDEENVRKLEELRATQTYFNKSWSPEDYSYIINMLGQFKDKRAAEIIKQRYLQPKKQNWETIAKTLNLSTQTVINIHSKSINLLRRKFQSKTISDTV